MRTMAFVFLVKSASTAHFHEMLCDGILSDGMSSLSGEDDMSHKSHVNASSQHRALWRFIRLCIFQRTTRM